MFAAENPAPSDLIRRIRTFRKTQFNSRMREQLVVTEDSRLATLTHGDFWSNNVMVNDDDPGTTF